MSPAAVIPQKLERLRSSQRSHTPGMFHLDGLTIHYLDAASLYTAYKDIFHNGIYLFQAESDRPRIIDGGACIGLSALYFKRLYPKAAVRCFEPDPMAAGLLRRNLADNAVEGVEVVEAALSDREGAAPFESDGADGGRLLDSCAGGDGRSSVRTVRLCDCLAEEIDFLKLNIEGQEWPVLRDLDRTGKLSLVRQLVLEYHGWPGGHQRLGDLLSLLDRSGFRYLVHDFDRQTNPASKPPFRLRSATPWFCLVYAKRGAGRPGVRTVPASMNEPSRDAADQSRDRFDPSRDRKGAGSNEPDHRIIKKSELGLGHAEPPLASDWGGLRRLEPLSRAFGLDRGRAIDRYYIEKFLARHARDIAGRTLEIAESRYTYMFGGDRVRQCDVLHTPPGGRSATLIGDLATGQNISTDAFNCIILTQTLNCTYDVRAVLANCHRALAPGGVVLATVPGISQISRYDMERWGDYWRFTSLAIRRLFEEAFGSGEVLIETHGNALVATAFIQGLAAEELKAEELDHQDPDYEVLIAIRARKPNSA